MSLISPIDGSSAGVDFVQWRWHQVRTLEAQQAAERESIELRKQLVSERASFAAANDKKVAALQSSLKKAKEGLNDLRKQQTVLKKQLQSDLNGWYSNSVTPISSLIKLIEKAKADSNNGQVHLLDKIGSLEKKLQEMTIAATEADSRIAEAAARATEAESKTTAVKTEAAAESDRLRKKIARLREEKGELEENVSKLSADLSVQRERNESLSNENQNLIGKTDSLAAELKRLKLFLAKVEEQGHITAKEMEQREAQLHNYYQQLLKEEAEVKQVLNEEIVELRLQVEGLTKTLMGNKTNFARYVEVKEQNVSLQQQLTQVLGGVGLGGAGALVGGGGSLSARGVGVPQLASKTLPTKQQQQGSNKTTMPSPRGTMQTTQQPSNHANIPVVMRPPAGLPMPSHTQPNPITARAMQALDQMQMQHQHQHQHQSVGSNAPLSHSNQAFSNSYSMNMDELQGYGESVLANLYLQSLDSNQHYDVIGDRNSQVPLSHSLTNPHISVPSGNVPSPYLDLSSLRAREGSLERPEDEPKDGLSNTSRSLRGDREKDRLRGMDETSYKYKMSADEGGMLEVATTSQAALPGKKLKMRHKGTKAASAASEGSDMLHVNTSYTQPLSIGVPIMSKQTRTALKDREGVLESSKIII